MTKEDLKEKLENNQLDEAVALIEEIGRCKDKESLPILIDYLRSTDNHWLRNKIAIALSDIGDPIVVEPIIEMIKNPKTLGNRGTLLYALEPFDCSQYIDLLVDLLGQDNFEVSRQSLLLIEKLASVPSEQLQNCINKVRHQIEELEDKTQFLYEAQDILLKIPNSR